jgi:hypothetical protein
MPATLLAVEQKEIWGFATTGPSQDTNLPNLRELWVSTATVMGPL